MGGIPFTDEEARRVCAICGEVFRRHKRSKPSVTCSAECRIEHYRQFPERFEIAKDIDWMLDRVIGDVDDCWEWVGAVDRHGYGRIVLQHKPLVTTGAHRQMWRLVYGELADDVMVLHHCDNPPCINPTHLFTGDNHANMQDMLTKGRNNVGVSGLLRVYPAPRGRWCAYGQKDEQRVFLGAFDQKEEAQAAREAFEWK